MQASGEGGKTRTVLCNHEGRSRRVIFNPGTEKPPLAEQLRQRGKEVLEAWTFVLLTTGQFGEE